MAERPRRVYLTGFMAAGKTAVGRLLARELGYRFVDLDSEIEKRCGESIREVFERQGEVGFRDLEHSALEATAVEPGVVVATGGGAMVFERNRDLIRRLGISVWLDPGFETILGRLDEDERRRRPLFEDEEQARALYEQRLDAYQMADLRVEISDADTAEAVVARIAKLI